MKKRIYASLIGLALGGIPLVQTFAQEVNVSDLQTNKSEKTVQVSFRIDVPENSVPTARTLYLGPVITDGTHRVSLPFIAVKGENTRISDLRREWASEVSGYPNTVLLQNGSQADYRAEIPYQSWMEGSELMWESIYTACNLLTRLPGTTLAKGLVLSEPEPEKPLQREPEISPAPELPASTGDKLAGIFAFMAPDSEFDANEPLKIYDDERENAPTVYFPQNTHRIEPAYLGNRRTLSNLVAAVDLVMKSADSEVTRIVIAGFSSPEGSFEYNDRLAWERAVSLKQYLVQETGLDQDNILIYNGSEDWRGLRAYVEKSDMESRNKVLRIIDQNPIQERIDALKAIDNGTSYRYLYENYFPLLRNGAFIKIYYRNR